MRVALFCLGLSYATATWAQPHGLPVDDRIRLGEAFSLADDVQTKAWANWGDAPFAVLLVTPDYEFLIRHPRPSDDFVEMGYDSLLASPIYVRPRTFSTNMLATFPAVGGLSTIVIGQPVNTDLTSSFWVITLLHEHFHQLQYSRPGYQAAVEALALSDGDETGMWMLDYPFPYKSDEVGTRFAGYFDALADALDRFETSDAAEVLERLDARRSAVHWSLSDRDLRYLSFQLWQEGVARYTEHLVAGLAIGNHVPLPEFVALSDYRSYETVADSLLRKVKHELRGYDLAVARRRVVYPVGAGEAMLLDAVVPDWKDRYFDHMFEMEQYVDAHTGR